jgi:hypothetical protein
MFVNKNCRIYPFKVYYIMKHLMKYFLTIFFLFHSVLLTLADEGMWIPLLLEKYNIHTMKEKGFKLSAEDIYSVNQACMKDAVMIFGGGCTAELISDKGLIITNHHCGFSRIQSHSSVENDYLTNGFWAMSKEEELPNPGLTVTFLVRMEDVTDRVLEGISDSINEIKRQSIISDNISKIKREAIQGTHYEAIIKPFYYGNEYYMFVQEEFEDVRLVGAPPSSIGKFGGDTDNWMWPRHTGDFSLFRIYADKNNKPSAYADDNVPYSPKKYFPISLKGTEKGDFTMILGYPGRTQEYIPSYAVRMISEVLNPHRINIRQKKIDILSAAMKTDKKIRIQYASKYNRVSNYWKKWIGENRGLKRLDAINKKEELETELTKWIQGDEVRKRKYGHLLPSYKQYYQELTPYSLALEYAWEAGFSLDPFRFAAQFRKIASFDKTTSDSLITTEVERLKNAAASFFKNYHRQTDKKVFREIMIIYYDSLERRQQPTEFQFIEKRFNGDIKKYTDYVYRKTILLNEEKLTDILNNFKPRHIKKISKDPVLSMYTSLLELYWNSLKPVEEATKKMINKLNRSYINALREFQHEKTFYPDANFTLRVAYGSIKGYEPEDGIKYTYYTTLSGVMEKDNPDIYDYNVPEKLQKIYREKDFGMYSNNGEMPVCFIATNHTTGGNSGSPVINAEGHLIGINFDRNWHGTMSDIMYDPNQCRNISLDIRYALFIIDKFADAGYLLDEMDIRN